MELDQRAQSSTCAVQRSAAQHSEDTVRTRVGMHYKNGKHGQRFPKIEKKHGLTQSPPDGLVLGSINVGRFAVNFTPEMVMLAAGNACVPLISTKFANVGTTTSEGASVPFGMK